MGLSLAVVSRARVSPEPRATGALGQSTSAVAVASDGVMVVPLVAVIARGFAEMSREIHRRPTRSFLPTSPRSEGSRQNASRSADTKSAIGEALRGGSGDDFLRRRSLHTRASNTTAPPGATARIHD
jgi:hypothetical protein